MPGTIVEATQKKVSRLSVRQIGRTADLHANPLGRKTRMFFVKPTAK